MGWPLRGQVLLTLLSQTPLWQLLRLLRLLRLLLRHARVTRVGNFLANVHYQSCSTARAATTDYALDDSRGAGRATACGDE